MARLGLLVCGAPLATRTADLTSAAAEAGWDVALTVTTAAEQWAQPSSAPPLSRDVDAVLVCPLTFNTANKWALGIADTPWLSTLNELIATGKPVVAVPMVNETLWRHPAWAGTIERLSTAGVVLVDPSTGAAEPRPVAHGSGEQVAKAFDPAWVLERLR
jgi:phosphopantothenoylcysteine synthetase/decarboxylase